MLARTLVVALTLALGACQTSGLPNLPERLEKGCTGFLAPAKAGEDARAIAARGFNAFGRCDRLQKDTAAFAKGLTVKRR